MTLKRDRTYTVYQDGYTQEESTFTRLHHIGSRVRQSETETREKINIISKNGEDAKFI